jgi:hypothetical protein
MGSAMRVPYTVGRWVRGENHYGRRQLIEHLLQAQERAFWLVGTRRMGKTSLLRQLEWVASAPGSRYTPIFWDMQGCQSARELSDELFFALEDVAARFAQHGIEVADYGGQDAPVLLRSLARAFDKQGKQLLVLVDEAEVLIEVAQREPAWVAHLRKSFHDERLRTVVSSTKLLAQLHLVSQVWNSGQFLTGFQLINLGKVDDEAARGLVRQAQSTQPVMVDDAIVEDVLRHTNGQPYLIQYLCQRLFQSDDQGNGTLRPMNDADLAVDHILAGFFQTDLQHLTYSERRLLLAVGQLTPTRESELMAALSDLSPARLQTFLDGLYRLGYLRQVTGQWVVGNEFLRRWLVEHHDELMDQLASSLDDRLMDGLWIDGL